MQRLGKEPDWSRITAEGLAALQQAVNRKRASRAARLIMGSPERGATASWRELALPDGMLRVRVHRPSSPGTESQPASMLPLIIQVHGGGFVGTAVQSDWLNSHLAARLPAVVLSVEHRLLDHVTPLPAPVDDVWDVLEQAIGHAEEWGVDSSRVALLGESAGALFCALVAIRARDAGLRLRAQVLVNPAVDLTEAGFDHDSMRRHADSPALNLGQMRMLLRLAVPPPLDARAYSPLLSADPTGLAPALVVVPTIDPLADHGRCYTAHLQAAGTPARLAEYRRATHGFLSMPNLVPQAKEARSEILEFLAASLY